MLCESVINEKKSDRFFCDLRRASVQILKNMGHTYKLWGNSRKMEEVGEILRIPGKIMRQ
jgi:hypothetical protein